MSAKQKLRRFESLEQRIVLDGAAGGHLVGESLLIRGTGADDVAEVR